MNIYINTIPLDIEVNDNSYRYRAIKGEHSLTLYFSLPEYVEIPVGAWCEFENETYTLEKPENFKMHNTRNFEYTLIMESAQAKLKNYKFRNPVDGRLKFNITYKPQEYLQMLIDNLNQRESGWSVGESIEAVEKNIAFNHTDCMSALSQIADAFETEWEVVGRTIHLRKVEYNKDKKDALNNGYDSNGDPIPLTYGRGKGFKPGVGRTNFSDSNALDILFVQGGEKNINASEYGSKELLLPKSQILKYDGKYFEGEAGFDVAVARTYVSDANGVSVRRQDKPLTSNVEGSLDLSEIYPSYPGVVTKVEVTKEGFCDFFDTNIPDALDYSTPESRFKGETMTIIFQSGQLAGKEFEIQQNEKRVYGYIHSERRFKVKEQTIDGVAMPKDAYMPVVGDKYAVFGVLLPKVFVCDNTTKTGASWDMFRQAVKYLYENEEPKFTFTGELDGIWAKQDWLNIGGKLKLGGYVLFGDSSFQPDGILIRIVGIKDFIHNPHSPTIDLSNGGVGGSIASDLRKIESNEVTVEQKHRDTLQFTKRRYRDAIETMEMLNEAMLDGFTNSVSPVSVRTMQLVAGDESLQYRFVDKGRDDILYDKSEKKWHIPAGRIQHMTIGVTKLSSSHDVSEYRFWDMGKFELAVLTDSSISYYIYAKVNRVGTTGVFVVSEKAKKMEEDSNYYYLLYGILNSGEDSERSFMPLYGFTELTPGRLTVPKIVSPDGKAYFDIENGVIGGKIVFEESANKYVTVIDGGKINTDCIDTDNLVAKKIRTSTSGRRIEINHDNSHAICMYSQTGPPGPPMVPTYASAAAPGISGEPSGPPGVPSAPQGNNPTLIIDGNNIASLTNFINPKEVPPSFAISGLNYSKTYDRYNIKPGFPKANAEPQTFLLTSSLFTISSDASGSLITHLPKMEFEVEGRGEGTSSRCSRGWIEVSVYLDSTLLGEKRISFTGYESPQLIVIEESNRKLSVGLHKIWVSLEGHYDLRTRTGESSLDPNTYLPVHLGVRLKNVSSSVSFSLVDKLTQIFANGFGSRYDTKKHFCVINSTGAPLVNVRGEQSYLSTDGETGLVINDDGVFYSRHTKLGTSGINTVIKGAVPSLVCMGVVNANGAVSPKWSGYVGSRLQTQRLSVGQYRVTMDGLFANGNDYIVTVTPNGPGSLYIVNQAANTFKVCNNSAADVGFTFFVYNVCGVLK